MEDQLVNMILELLLCFGFFGLFLWVSTGEDVQLKEAVRELLAFCDLVVHFALEVEI